MDEKKLRGALEALADTLEIQVRYENMDAEMFFSPGGFCRIKNKPFIIIDSRSSEKLKIQTLIKALKRFDLSQIYIKPALRELLEAHNKEETP